MGITNAPTTLVGGAFFYLYFFVRTTKGTKEKTR